MSMDNSGRNLRRIHHCDVHGLQWKEFEKNTPLWIGAGGKVVMCQALLQLVVFVHERGALWSKAGPVFFFFLFFIGFFWSFFFFRHFSHAFFTKYSSNKEVFFKQT